MDDEFTYSLDNLSNDPAFNFLNTISETTDADEDSQMYDFSVNMCAPDVIALQEIWQIQDPAFFPLPNYNLIEFKCCRNKVQGGGVGLFFKNSVRYNILEKKCIFIDCIFE